VLSSGFRISPQCRFCPGRIESHHRIPNKFIGTFSDAVVVETGDYLTIYVSGQIGNDASSKATAKAFGEEAQLGLAISPMSLETSDCFR